jgi:hypothetical protein
MRSKHLLVAALVLLGFSLPARGQPPRPGKAELPVTRIVLFSSGVGYFQREGQVDGNARIDLQFHAQDVNDLLKSLVLQDQGGGQVSTVHYDNRDPIDRTLKSFAIDLTRNPSVADLLQQVRGERVEIVSYGEPGKEGQPATLTGVIVSVQPIKKPVGKDQVLETEQLNLLTSDGLQGVGMAQVQRVKFLRPELEQEFRKALDVLATGHDKQKKTVSLNFLGAGMRAVRVGYVTESPLWKTSYRLILDGEKGKADLQGWAIVENTTDEDWNGVSLGLVSGRPISFQMDLYEPLYVPRPIVEPELFASLRPQTYSGDLDKDQKKNAFGTQNIPTMGMMTQMMGARGPAEPGRSEAARRFAFARDGKGGPMEQSAEKKADFRQGVVSAAVATELGEYFKYEVEQPVSLPRQKSALLPIVKGPVEAAKVSIYNESVHAKFPLLGLRLKNTTDLHLMQGPITIIDQGAYAGDARITDLQPKETRLLSYAVDLGTEVAPEVPQPADSLTAVKAYKGILYATHKVRHTKVYTIKNRSEHPHMVLLEHPYRADLALLKPEKPSERTREVYRFEVKVAPGETVKREVVEEQQRVDQVVLTTSDDETVRFFVRGSVSSARVKQALEQTLRLKSELAQTQTEIRTEEEALAVIEKDQARMRANMERVPQTSQAYKRYLQKFDDQETEIEKRRATVSKLQQKSESQRKEFEAFLLSLNVE